MTRLRLDLIVTSQPKTFAADGGWLAVGMVDRWTWRLWSGSRIVSSSGSQLYSRRIDCARGAEVGAGLQGVVDTLRSTRKQAQRVVAGATAGWNASYGNGFVESEVAAIRRNPVEVRIIDEREAKR